MKLKIGFIVASTLFLIIVLCNVYLVFAQTWTTCVVSCNCTNYVMDETNGFFSFTVAPQNPSVTNTITVVNQLSGENHAETLSLGDTVVVRYTQLLATDPVYSPEVSGFLNYMGPADSVTINAVEIPEFPLILIIPLFMTATLLALIYRRKRTSQSQKTD